MSVVRWKRALATAVIDPLQVDELDGHVLVLEDVRAADDEQLHWCRRAPCVVIACSDTGQPSAAAPDIALVGEEREELDRLIERIDANPDACRTLVDVLRPMPLLDVASGLTLESLAYSMLLAGDEFTAWLADQPTRRSRSFESEPVRTERDDGDLHITLSRAGNRNAFSAAMRDALFETLSFAILDDSIERIILSGDGPVFSSGGDLTEFGTTPDVVRAHELRTQRSIGALLGQLASKVIVVVQGSCVGAGVELSAFAGRVIAEPHATFQLPEVSMGLIPGAGGTVSVTRRIGRQRTARFAILGEPIGTAEALDCGLIDDVG